MTAAGTRQPAHILSDLVGTCGEAERSFRAAAKRLEDPALRRLLESYAEQRAAFGRELERELATLGQVLETPAEPEWADDRRLRKIPEFSPHEGTVIAQCALREQASVRAYEEAVAWGLAGQAGAAVERHYLQVKDAREHLLALAQAGAA
jgi:uncharacterized protein (TIGR02284 family)